MSYSNINPNGIFYLAVVGLISVAIVILLALFYGVPWLFNHIRVV